MTVASLADPVTVTPFSGIHLLCVPGEVMVPRPATEALVDQALARLGDRAARVADVGTGSGAIAVALALRAPRARIWATDTSAAAVQLARANVSRHGLGDRVDVLHADLLDGVPGALDLVVANLPYLPDSLRPLRPELAGEPPEAVFAPGDGLGHYRGLLAACRHALRPDGAVAIQYHRRVIVAEADELEELPLAA
jgi:release factor glutamine methyltransferase